MNDFRLVEWNDICADPAEFIGQPIELRKMRCVYGMDGFRCVAFPRKITASAKTVTVSAKSVIPAGESAVLKNNCTTLQAMLQSAACRKNIRIIPAQFSEWFGGEVAKSVELNTDKIQILPGSRPKRYAGNCSASAGGNRSQGASLATGADTRHVRKASHSWNGLHSVFGQRRGLGLTEKDARVFGGTTRAEFSTPSFNCLETREDKQPSR
ncbi:hypothetical protein [Bradyrhizobium sp. USDA 4520]